MSARIAQGEAGFEVLFVSASNVAASLLGVPDASALKRSDMAAQLARIRAAAPSALLMVDCHGSCSSSMDVRIAVRNFGLAGAAGVTVEDWVQPQLGRDGKLQLPFAEACVRVRAAVDARNEMGEAGPLIVARTDAPKQDQSEAQRRAKAFAAMGADIVFLEAPVAEANRREVCVAMPRMHVMANLVEGGTSPLPGLDRLGKLGYKLALHPAPMMTASAAAMRRWAEELCQSAGAGHKLTGPESAPRAANHTPEAAEDRGAAAPAARLRQLLGREGCVTAPGVSDALSARVAHGEVGFEVLFVNSACASASFLGTMDSAMMSHSDVVAQVARAKAAAPGALLVAESRCCGGRGPVARHVRELCLAGAACVLLQDSTALVERHQGSAGAAALSFEEACARVRSAAEARDELGEAGPLIMAHCDVRVHGEEESAKRGRAFAELGADLVFLDNVRWDQGILPMAIPGAHVAARGRMPHPGSERLEKVGIKLALYPMLMTSASVSAMYCCARRLRSDVRRGRRPAAPAAKPNEPLPPLMATSDIQRMFGPGRCSSGAAIENRRRRPCRCKTDVLAHHFVWGSRQTSWGSVASVRSADSVASKDTAAETATATTASPASVDFLTYSSEEDSLDSSASTGLFASAALLASTAGGASLGGCGMEGLGKLGMFRSLRQGFGFLLQRRAAPSPAVGGA